MTSVLQGGIQQSRRNRGNSSVVKALYGHGRGDMFCEIELF
ncbi:MAG: hypothetical protein A4E70_01886 [Syntrophus sp. PtaU1.Bin005]|nr:MAG: hypothetical protein A4E70_01886 [Syntrophus sp. PtaU1.Bin005]